MALVTLSAMEQTVAIDATMYVEQIDGFWWVFSGWMGTGMACRETEAGAWERALEIATNRKITNNRTPPIRLPDPPAPDPVI